MIGRLRSVRDEMRSTYAVTQLPRSFPLATLTRLRTGRPGGSITSHSCRRDASLRKSRRAAGFTGSHADSTAQATSPRGSPGSSPAFLRDVTRTPPLFDACPLHAGPRDPPMTRHRLDAIRCASFRTLRLPASVATPARTSERAIRSFKLAIAHRPCRCTFHVQQQVAVGYRLSPLPECWSPPRRPSARTGA